MPTSTTTPAAIRDRIATVIEGIAPTSLAGDRFREYRNEREARFEDWCETHAAGALRRFQVIETGEDGPPETSSGVEEHRRVNVLLTIAYPMTGRYGADQALDRHDVMREDERKIERQIAHLGRANFTAPTYPAATWIGHSANRVQGESCEYLVLELTYLYVLDVS